MAPTTVGPATLAGAAIDLNRPFIEAREMLPPWRATNSPTASSAII
jgi:hypothetical protein